MGNRPSNQNILEKINISTEKPPETTTLTDEEKTLAGIKQLSDKLDENLRQHEKTQQNVAQFEANVASSVNNARREILTNVKNFRAEISELQMQSIKSSRIALVISQLETIFSYFGSEINYFSKLTVPEKGRTFQKPNSFVRHLLDSRFPTPGSLYSLLIEVIHEKYAIPKDKNDKIGFHTLELLCSGAKMFDTILSFLLTQYSEIKNYYREKKDIAHYNQIRDEELDEFKEFSNAMIAPNGLFDKVIETLEAVSSIDFVHFELTDKIQYVKNEIEYIKAYKTELAIKRTSLESEIVNVTEIIQNSLDIQNQTQTPLLTALTSQISSTIATSSIAPTTKSHEPFSKPPKSEHELTYKPDIGGTILLLDLLARIKTGKRFIPTLNQLPKSTEARIFALNITEQFEQLMNKVSKQSGIELHNIDYFQLFKTLEGYAASGQNEKIDSTLYAIVGKAFVSHLDKKLLQNMKMQIDKLLNSFPIESINENANQTQFEANEIRAKVAENKLPQIEAQNVPLI